jgi:hypothetical protein
MIYSKNLIKLHIVWLFRKKYALFIGTEWVRHSHTLTRDILKIKYNDTVFKFSDILVLVKTLTPNKFSESTKKLCSIKTSKMIHCRGISIQYRLGLPLHPPQKKKNKQAAAQTSIIIKVLKGPPKASFFFEIKSMYKWEHRNQMNRATNQERLFFLL